MYSINVFEKKKTVIDTILANNSEIVKHFYSKFFFRVKFNR